MIPHLVYWYLFIGAFFAGVSLDAARQCEFDGRWKSFRVSTDLMFIVMVWPVMLVYMAFYERAKQ